MKTFVFEEAESVGMECVAMFNGYGDNGAEITLRCSEQQFDDLVVKIVGTWEWDCFVAFVKAVDQARRDGRPPEIDFGTGPRGVE